MSFEYREIIDINDSRSVKAVSGAGKLSDQAMSFNGYAPRKKPARKKARRFGLLLDEQIGDRGEGYKTAGYGRDGRKSEVLYKTRDYN